MARLRQQFPQNYITSGNISQEFESVIRYLNSAELGNHTIAELLRILFDDEGRFIGPVELRRDASSGIEYRVGSYSDPDNGWKVLASLEELRGEPGQSVGEVGAPIFFARLDYTGDDATTVFSYAHDESDDVLVFLDGFLQTPTTHYTTSPTNGNVTFVAAPTNGQLITFYRVRAAAISGYQRTDTVTDSTQAAFPFEFSDDTQIMVYRNGIMQRPGGSHDYTAQPESNTITFNTALPAGNLVTILTGENIASQTLTGFMFEAHFVNPATGLIRLDKVELADDAIGQEKVNGLVTALSNKAVLHISATTPVDAETGHFWLNTARNPNQLFIYDGVQWLATTPDAALPTFSTSNAGQYVRLNGTGTGYEYGAIDFSGLIEKNTKGAANGVASLDSSGHIPTSQLPEVLSQSSVFRIVDGVVSDGDITFTRIFRQRVRVEAISLRLTSGTCTAELIVNGVVVGSAHAVSSTPIEITLGSIVEIDATASSKTIGLRITNASSPDTLDAAIAISNLTL
ncbi:hypothetical protein GCM10023116_48310 [Kistimonas scapharcae]|uniref:Uncharacterized protein n=1 Tax=Kistimonas scapharcae TaxID=1036133 RepID=A0ABP8VC41_9GAMM